MVAIYIFSPVIQPLGLILSEKQRGLCNIAKIQGFICYCHETKGFIHKNSSMSGDYFKTDSQLKVLNLMVYKQMLDVPFVLK